MSNLKDLAKLKHLEYNFDAGGNLITKGNIAPVWELQLAERETLIPKIKIFHCHYISRSKLTKLTMDTSVTQLKSIDKPCDCGVEFPKTAIMDVFIGKVLFMHHQLYTSIQHSSWISGMKNLSNEWLLDERSLPPYREPAVLYHICNDNHPAYFFYGRGIPIAEIAMPPYEDKCKTCKCDIPKGIRIALLMKHQNIKLT